jgi:hypothetical protein
MNNSTEMTRSTSPRYKHISARKAAIRSAMAVNNVLTEYYLFTKSDEEVLCFVHPAYRQEIGDKLGISTIKRHGW